MCKVADVSMATAHPTVSGTRESKTDRAWFNGRQTHGTAGAFRTVLD